MAVRRFEIVSEITDVEPIAVGRGIRDLARLLRRYGRGPWRKMQGVANIRLENGQVRRAELHPYEAERFLLIDLSADTVRVLNRSFARHSAGAR